MPAEGLRISCVQMDMRLGDADGNFAHAEELVRAAVERELYGAKAPWQHDEEHYAFCGGGFPLYVSGEFRGAAIISGLPHLKDHALLCETVKAYWESKKK